jgi:hypothetical protein
VSDYDYSEFGNWDEGSGSYYNYYSPPSRPLDNLPPSSPLHHALSPLGLNLSPILEVAQVIERVATPQASAAISAPVSPVPRQRSVTPELQYPSSPTPTVQLAPRPRSLTPRHVTPDSPIDYEGAARRIIEITPELEAELNFRPATPEPVFPHVNQENQPPVPVFRRPPCHDSTEEHPHQYIAVTTDRGEEWRPIAEFYQQSIHHIRTAAQLCRVPPVFPGVTPFRFKSPHYIAIYPRQYQVALDLGLQPLFACSKAILDQPSADLPLGSIKYNFRDGIREAFAPLNNLIRAAYEYALVVVEIQDFLDGRWVTTYGYLRFHNRHGVDQIFTVQQTYHFEDSVRTSPHLLNYCFTPRIPADPFDFISTYHDDQPL